MMTFSDTMLQNVFVELKHIMYYAHLNQTVCKAILWDVQKYAGIMHNWVCRYMQIIITNGNIFFLPNRLMEYKFGSGNQKSERNALSLIGVYISNIARGKKEEICYIEGDDDTGGVIGRQLDAGAEEAMQIRILRRESGAWDNKAHRLDYPSNPRTQSTKRIRTTKRQKEEEQPVRSSREMRTRLPSPWSARLESPNSCVYPSRNDAAAGLRSLADMASTASSSSSPADASKGDSSSSRRSKKHREAAMALLASWCALLLAFQCSGLPCACLPSFLVCVCVGLIERERRLSFLHLVVWMQVQQQAHSIAIGDLFYGHLQVLLHPLSLLFSLLSLSIRQVAFALHEREREILQWIVCSGGRVCLIKKWDTTLLLFGIVSNGLLYIYYLFKTSLEYLTH